MIVIKLGGSLAKSGQLAARLDHIAKQQQPVVLVPGGGEFADQVRAAQQQWQFDDRVAHAMALLAMQQMAWLIKGLQPDFVLFNSLAELHGLLATNKPLIWLPNLDELNQAGVAASWDISSDSLAAWLAKQISAKALWLIKSTAIDARFSIRQLAETGIVDSAFCSSIEGASFSITIIHAEQFNDRF